MKNGTTPTLRRAMIFRFEDPKGDVEIILEGDAVNITQAGDADATLRLTLAGTSLFREAIEQIVKQIGETEQPLAPSRKRTDVQGAILTFIDNSVSRSISATGAVETLCSALGMTTDQVSAALRRMQKTGMLTKDGAALRRRQPVEV